MDFLHNSTYLKYSKNPGLLRERIEAIGVDKLTGPVIIDEVQKVPEVLDEIHWMIEHFKGVAFVMCGSSIRKLKAIGSNFLGGRAWRQIFLPLCYPELPEFDLLRIFNHGLIPSHFLAQAYPKRSLEGYLADYVIPEVQWESKVRDLGSFTRFLEAVAFSNAQLVNYSNISRECFVSVKTVQGYIEILLDMLLGYLIYPYTKRSSRQVVVSQPKFYFFDTALPNALLKRKIELLKGPEAGCSLEHYVFLELVAYKNIKDVSCDIKYWRTKTGLEVDFIIEAQQLIAIEVKISSNIDKADISGLIAFTRDATPGRSLVVCLESQKRILTVGEVKIEVWPLEEFLKELWSGQIIT
jgi:predicted AAA+ superfamily ATPase